MKKLVQLIFFSCLVVFKASASAGGRGGGTGILCGEKLVTIEEYDLVSKGKKIKFPTNRGGVRKLLKSKIKNKEFYELWLKTWETLGSYKKWHQISMKKYAQDLVTQMSLKAEELNLKNIFTEDEFELEHDDVYDRELADNCKKIQIALFQGGSVLRNIDNIHISQQTKRIIELHESLFMIGSELYYHFNARKTQDLVKELISEKKDIEKSLRNFLVTEKEKSFTYLISNFFEIYSGDPNICYANILISSPPKENTVVDFVTSNSEHFKIESQSFGSNKLLSKFIQEPETSNYAARLELNENLTFYIPKDYRNSELVFLKYTLNNNECSYYNNSGRGTKKIARLKFIHKIIQAYKANQ